jgi:hypothetical protein
VLESANGMSAPASDASSSSQQPQPQPSHNSFATHVDWRRLLSVLADVQPSSPSDAGGGKDAVWFLPAAQPPPPLPGSSRAAVTFMRHVVRVLCRGNRPPSHTSPASVRATGCSCAQHQHHLRRRPPAFTVSHPPPCVCGASSKVTKWVPHSHFILFQIVTLFTCLNSRPHRYVRSLSRHTIAPHHPDTPHLTLFSYPASSSSSRPPPTAAC